MDIKAERRKLEKLDRVLDMINLEQKYMENNTTAWSAYVRLCFWDLVVEVEKQIVMNQRNIERFTTIYYKILNS
jgi:hypothetical protein